MRTWTPPELVALPGQGAAPKLFNTATGRLEHPPIQDQRATLYVCGITPYDATHIGHAFTYLTFDILQRAWLDAGIAVSYAQNITDVDDPLLQRAGATGVEWRQLAAEQIGLFRSDMHRLGMLPPEHFVPVTEVITEVSYAVKQLLERGYAYQVPQSAGELPDIYFDTRQAAKSGHWCLGDVAPYTRELMEALSAERGGDPERESKHDTIDPLLWRAAREGEPSWDSPIGKGRPGWHIECSVIARKTLGEPITVQGGGHDLIFPHHEFSAAHASVITGTPFAHLYSHNALVAYNGHKMSKSRGNLVFVSKLLNGTHCGRAVAAGAIRLALLAHHYRSEWEWFDSDLELAERRLAAWQAGLHKRASDPFSAKALLQQMRAALANDLDTPVLLAAIDAALGQGVDDPHLIAGAVRNLIGIELSVADISL